jgi:hypothetical protein
MRAQTTPLSPVCCLLDKIYYFIISAHFLHKMFYLHFLNTMYLIITHSYSYHLNHKTSHSVGS